MEIYENGLLTSNRLNFIIKNCSDFLWISSSLLKKLIKNNEIQLLSIIFDNFKFYDNEFIIMLLYQYKNKISISVTDINRMMSNDQYIISINQTTEDYPCKILKEDSPENIQDYFVDACGDGKEHIIKYLFEHGADVNEVNDDDDDDETPLCCSCWKGNEKIVKYLIKHGADVNKGNGSKKTSLHCVCEEGNERIAKYLIEHGAGMRIVDMNGDSPLFMACKSGNENLVKYFVELGANIKKKKKNAKRETLLFMACETGNENLVKYLVELGIDITIKNKHGRNSFI